MLGIKDIIYRYRHNWGFGVQSPNAFHFVTSVIAEKYSYYAYPAINCVAAKCGYKAALARLIFRIANYVRPQNILMYEPCEAIACALSMARPSAPVSVFRQGEPFGLLYVGETRECFSVVEQAVKCVSANSVIIIDGIHRSREMKNSWNKIKQNAAVAVTFDLYSMGVLFFDKSYKKQNYTLKK